jgi:hypothetical protein
VVGVRRPCRHILVGGDLPRRSSVLRRPLVVGVVPPRRPSVRRWPSMPHHPLLVIQLVKLSQILGQSEMFWIDKEE